MDSRAPTVRLVGHCLSDSNVINVVVMTYCLENTYRRKANNFNTGYQSSMSDVTILHFEENWHRRTFKQDVNIHRELDFIKASVIAILVKMAVLAVMNWTSSVALV